MFVTISKFKYLKFPKTNQIFYQTKYNFQGKCINSNSIRCFSSNTQDKKESNNDESKTHGVPVTFITLGLTGIACGVLLFYYNIEKDRMTQKLTREVNTIGKPALGGPWVLVDSHGIPKTDASYLGNFVLLYFGFTYCPDICPNELVKIGKIVDLVAKNKISPSLKPLFISVDPARDTIGQMKHYAVDFHPDLDFLTGTPDQISKATKAFRVYFSKANENDDNEDDYLVDHSIVLYLIAPDGEFLDFFTQKMQLNDIVEKIKRHSDAWNAKQK